MKISTKGRYALRMMVDLAQNQGDGYVSLKDIAARQGISKKYLEQIVSVLNKPDILRTNRGPCRPSGCPGPQTEMQVSFEFSFFWGSAPNPARDIVP